MEENKNTIKEMFFNSLKSNFRQYTMVFALISIWIVFTLLTGNVFLSTRNLSNLFLQSATIAVLAMGMVLIIVSGHIDLSVGSVVGFIGSVIAFSQVKMGMGTVPSLIIAIIIGFLLGAWHGYWVAYRGVPAFVVTLASMLIFKGGTLGVTGGTTISPLHSCCKAISQGYFPKLFSDNIHDSSIIFLIVSIVIYIIYEINMRKTRKTFGFEVIPLQFEILKIIGVSGLIVLVSLIFIDYRGIPNAVFIILIIAIVLTFIANNTTFGRQIYAIGGNRDTAELSGINVKKRLLELFMMMGVLTAGSAIIFTARLGAATASAGNMFELDAIAGAVIGGTSFSGGKGTIVGAVVGALVMASLDNGMSLMNLDVTYQYIVKGLILLFAVWVDSLSSQHS